MKNLQKCPLYRFHVVPHLCILDKSYYARSGDAAMDYQQRGVPLVVIAGKEYGTGSSRDWAAKGTRLLGYHLGFFVTGSYAEVKKFIHHLENSPSVPTWK